MNDNGMETRVADWLRGDPTRGPEHVLVAALARTREVRQRPAWVLVLMGRATGAGLSPWPTRMAPVPAVLVAIGLLLAVAVAAWVGSHRVVQPPPPPTVAPSTAPTTSPSSAPSPTPAQSASPLAIATRPAGSPWASIDWTLVDPQPFSGGQASVSAVIPVGNGFLAVGSVQDQQTASFVAAAWLTEDGLHWTKVTGVDTGDVWSDVAAGPDGLVAVGTTMEADLRDVNKNPGGVVWRSPDGRDWTRERSPSLVGMGLREVAVGPGGAVLAWSDQWDLLLSTKVGTWEHLSSDWIPSNAAGIHAVFGDESRFAMIGGAQDADRVCHAAIWASVDGRTWQTGWVDPEASSIDHTSPGPKLFLQGTTGPCQSESAPLVPAFWSWPDGGQVQRLAVSLPEGSCSPNPYSGRDLCIAGDARHVTIVGPAGDVLLSEDGTTWWRAVSTIAGGQQMSVAGNPFPRTEGFQALAVGERGIVAVVSVIPVYERSGVSVWFGAANPP